MNSHVSRLQTITLMLGLCLSSALAFSAQEAPQTFTFDGRAFSNAAATTALLDSINVRVQILNQAQDCILYEEQQSVNTTATDGYFTIQVGSVTSAAKRSALDSNHNMSQVFSNTITSLSGKLVSNGAACTYSPLNAHVRYVRILMTPSDGITRAISPNMALDSVPYALAAERADTLQGLYPTDLLLVNNTAPTALTQANLEAFFTTPAYTNLQAVAAGNYVQKGAGGASLPQFAGAPGSPVAGNMWYDSTANQIKYYNGTSTQTLGTGSSGSFSGISAAVATDSIDNTNYAQSWNWSTATTQNPLSIAANALTTGTILNLTTSSASLNSTSGLLNVANTSASTTGTVARIQSNSTSGSGLYVLANGNVGIGTTNPQGPLHITSAGGHLIAESTNNYGPLIDFRWSGSQKWGVLAAGPNDATTGNGNFGIYSYTLGNSPFVITPTGNVGVGTTAPQAPLDVAGDVKIGNSAAACSATNKGSIRYNNASSVLEFCNGSSWNLIQAAACTNATPSVFSFSNQANVVVSTLTTSNIVQVTGMNCSVPVTISGQGTPQFQICSDSGCGTVVQGWTSSPAAIVSGQYLQIRLTSNATGGATNTASIYAGGAASIWTVSTASTDCTVASPPIGSVCADGSIYAGLSPDAGGVKMYTQRCDLGQTWNGSACTGSRLLLTWNNGSTNWTATGFTSYNTGKANTAGLYALADAGAPYYAAQHCVLLNEDGHTDWYLPAVNELNVLYVNKNTILNFDVSGAAYWSSSEYGGSTANYMYFSDGYVTASGTKALTYPVRCVRR